MDGMWKGKDVWTKNGEIDRQAALRVDNALGVARLSSHFSFVTRFEKKKCISLSLPCSHSPSTLKKKHRKKRVASQHEY